MSTSSSNPCITIHCSVIWDDHLMTLHVNSATVQHPWYIIRCTSSTILPSSSAHAFTNAEGLTGCANRHAKPCAKAASIALHVALVGFSTAVAWEIASAPLCFSCRPAADAQCCSFKVLTCHQMKRFISGLTHCGVPTVPAHVARGGNWFCNSFYS